jgi:hypothetical protein
LASALTPGATGVLMPSARYAALGSVTISRNQLVGTSVETLIDNDLGATMCSTTGLSAIL